MNFHDYAIVALFLVVLAGQVIIWRQDKRHKAISCSTQRMIQLIMNNQSGFKDVILKLNENLGKK